jgi:hypothetical protein
VALRLAESVSYSFTFTTSKANPSPIAEIGVAFCSGGGFFFIFGLILFFDRALLAMGNILFLIGITLLLGPQRTFVFFARKNKWKGTLAFWAGVLLILMRWPLVGFGVEVFGIFVLFGVSFMWGRCGFWSMLDGRWGWSDEIGFADMFLLAGVLQDDCRFRVQYSGHWAVPGEGTAGCWG